MTKSKIPNEPFNGLRSIAYGLLKKFKTIDYRPSTIDPVISFNICALCLFLILCFGISIHSYAQDKKIEEPIIVNGDIVEYSTTSKEVSATGNVEVDYKGAKLTCQKLTVNTETKDAFAEGNARLDDQRGVIEGEKITYNFDTKAGTIIDSEFRSNPYFGKAKTIEKVSEKQFIALNGYVTTCSFDKPHYRIKSKKTEFFTGDKLKTAGDTFYLGNMPLLHLPRYNHSLRDPLMHVQLMPGKRKEWGYYLLTGWRYNLTNNVNGRLYLDYREKLGLAEGFGANYNNQAIGKGDFKFYFTQERPKGLPQDDPAAAEAQRYLIRWRHKWDIDKNTNFVSEYYKINDERRKKFDPQTNLLKDYFFREYEKDSQPYSYIYIHHSFNYSSIDLIMQKRTNHWFDQLEKLPQLSYSLPSYRLGETPIYFENISTVGNFNKKATTPPVTEDEVKVARFDSTNKLSLPINIAFFKVTPFVSSRQTIYDKGADRGSFPVRSIFYTGAEVATKFYRLFNVKSNFLGMDINGLRHIITPTISYAYNHDPTITSSHIKQIDAVDSIGRSNSVSFELSNKLQTKRSGQSVDLVDLKVNSIYNIYSADPQTGIKSRSNFTDFLIEFKLLPYSWLRFDADATYKSELDYFSIVNYDVNFDFGKERSLGIGQRYQRKGGNEITCNLNWRLNPKWKFSTYHRYNRGHDPELPRGIREQEYTISRDMHCWTMEITFNERKGEGTTIWFVFRLKAFPELEFGFSQSYNKPKSGSQTNP